MTEEQPEEVLIQFTPEEADMFSLMAYDLILTGLSMLIGWGRKQGIHEFEIARMQALYQEFEGRLLLLRTVREKVDEFAKEGNVGYG